MSPAPKTLQDLIATGIRGKRILLRADLNVPMAHGHVTNAARLRAAAATIKPLMHAGAKVIVISHFGRPQGLQQEFSLKPVAATLAGILGHPVAFAGDCIGPVAQIAITHLQPGGVLCLENLRFHAEEEANAPAFVASLAGLADAYVNDAFSASHRTHASIVGLAHALPAYAGISMEAELAALANALTTPRRPLSAIIGGAKISTKLALLENLLTHVDTLIIGGAMANTFLAAQGHAMGASLTEPAMFPTAKRILAIAKNLKRTLILPEDLIVATTLEPDIATRIATPGDVQADEMALDIGPATITTITAALQTSATVIWNGPLGAFETPPFDAGTAHVAKSLVGLNLSAIAGGGDTLAALEAADATANFTYLSNAGGAFLEWLEGKTLPGIAALTRN